MTTDPKKPRQDLDAECDAWIAKHLATWPALSDDRWRQLFAHFGLVLVEDDTDPSTSSGDGQ